jgi:hypothetical protein
MYSLVIKSIHFAAITHGDGFRSRPEQHERSKRFSATDAASRAKADFRYLPAHQAKLAMFNVLKKIN